MSSDLSIKVSNVSKLYKLYNKPIERLKETLHPGRKKYCHEFYALNNISFEVKKGETVGIIGKNGSGKSTLLKMITGVLTPSSGIIHVDGKISALLELGAGFNPEFTGLENIYLNGTIMGFSKEDMDSKLESILTFAEIGDYINQPVKMYSSGMFARLAFAVAINVEPEILIVDEALAVGDVRFQAKCFNKFKELKESGVTILFVSHDVYSVRNFCDRVIWINEGQLQQVGATIEVTASYVEYMNRDQTSAIANDVNEDVQEKVTQFNPINRWGRNVGLIKSAVLFNSSFHETEVFEVGEPFTIKITAYISSEVNASTLSVAFSIKNTAGQDLIVSTTYDNELKGINRKDCLIEVQFTLNNYLNQGDYVLIAALEDRTNPSPEYYDYIEGAAYFKVTSKKQLFGLINVPVEQNITFLK
ncbi:MAG: ABC transporter ATP-binding protein [Bacillota bacterium]